MTKQEQVQLFKTLFESLLSTIDNELLSDEGKLEVIYRTLKPDKWGCMEKQAVNYDPEATLPGPCEYVAGQPPIN